MVNPYALSSRTSTKSPVRLSQSQGLKKFEKFKMSSSVGIRSKTPDKKGPLDSSNDEGLSNSDGSQDEDSAFSKNLRKSSNRFIKV